MRKSWVVAGSDDMQVRVFNYNTLEKVHTFEAHTDYIRSIIVHPTHPYVLTSSGKVDVGAMRACMPVVMVAMYACCHGSNVCLLSW